MHGNLSATGDSYWKRRRLPERTERGRRREIRKKHHSICGRR